MRFTVNGVAFDFVPIPAGQFLMGSDNQFFAEAPAHSVTFRAGFLLGKFPVTQAQWLAVMGDNPSAFPGPDNPVENVDWHQSMEFCRRLAEYAGQPARLPSEAEWEYANRAGTTLDFFFGEHGPFSDDSDIPSAVRRELGEYAWFDLNSNDSTHPAGQKRPNPWGLFDMVGNVWEWCLDVWHGDYKGAPGDCSPWLEGAGHQPRRCQRGGAWDMNAFRCRSSYRSYGFPDLAGSKYGFRVAIGP